MSLDQIKAFVKSIDTSCDKFLGESLTILQPKKGFRAGIDSVLLGASVSNIVKLNIKNKKVEGERRLLDLGAGVGVAGICALKFNKNLSAVLLEKNPEMVLLAQENIKVNGFDKRAKTIELDLTLSGKSREAAGLKVNYFDWVIANPPFFDIEAGTVADGLGRANARAMAKEDLGKWVRVAASCAKAKGGAVFIFPVAGLMDLLNEFDGRFGDIDILPIVSRQGENASRFLVRGVKGSNAPLKMHSPLILHAKKGHGYLPQIEEVFRGEKPLLW